MTVAVAVALGEASAGAVGYGAASVLQARAARGGGDLAVVARPWYVAGLLTDLAAWCASVLAVRVLPLFVVQSLLATSLAVTVLLAWPLLGHRPVRRDLVAVVVAVAALAGLGWTARPAPARSTGAGLLVAVGLALVLAVAWFLGRSRTGGGREQAVLAGWAFAWLAVCARALPLPRGAWATATAVWSAPLAWGGAAFGVVGTLAFARAVQRARVGPVTVTMWVVEVLVAGAVGVAVLGDGVRSGAGWLAGSCVAALLVTCGVLGSGMGSALDEPREPGGEQALGDQCLPGGVGVVAVRGQQVGDVPSRGRPVERRVETDEGRPRPPRRVTQHVVGLEGEGPRGPQTGP